VIEKGFLGKALNDGEESHCIYTIGSMAIAEHGKQRQTRHDTILFTEMMAWLTTSAG
jgi:hypothetical protein